MNGPKAGGNKRHTVMAEINMVPFIDVCLVLLIIFMVMTPMLVQSQIKINVPTASSAEPSTKKNDMILVQVDAKGGIYVDDQRIPTDRLADLFKKRLVKNKDNPIVIEADKDVPFNSVVSVMDAAKAAGATKLGVSAKAEKKNKR